MSEHSAIEWTDATWNPVRGCVKVSPGCAHCYAETFAERFRGVPGHPYEQGFDLRLVPEKLDEPLRWKKPRRVFVNSMSDLFQDGVPDEYIDRVFAVMALAPQHTFQVLTKRAERMRRYLSDVFDAAPHDDRRTAVELALWDMHTDDTTNAISRWPLRNVWLGVSVENQHFADERIPLLLQTPAAVRFISAEPLLGPVDLANFLTPCDSDNPHSGSEHSRTDGEALAAPRTALRPGSTTGYKSTGLLGNGAGSGPAGSQKNLDWVIVGGESGNSARPFDLAWGRSIVDQCRSARVPAFVKQLGAWPLTERFPNDVTINGFPLKDGGAITGNRLLLHSKKGGNPSEWPEDLRVREFPR